MTAYKSVNHGEAVAIGMVAAGAIATKMQMWNPQDSQRQNKLIAKVGLPTAIPKQLHSQEIIATLQSDKKVKAGKVRFVLPTAIGKVTITDQVAPELLQEVINDQ